VRVLVWVRPSPIDVADNAGLTALHWAIKRGHGAAIQRLVQSGASLVKSESNGRSALHLAVSSSAEFPADRRPFFHDMVRYLIQSGGDVAWQDNDGATPLHYAAEINDIDLIAILVEIGGAAVNACDDEGESALFYALREGHVEAAKKLVDFGVDLQSQNASNETVVDFCQAVNDAACAEFLSMVLRPLAASNGAKRELDTSANIFGSNTFRPVFSGNSSLVNR